MVEKRSRNQKSVATAPRHCGLDSVSAKFKNRASARFLNFGGRIRRASDFVSISGHVASISGCFVSISRRFVSISGRFASISGRFALVSGRFVSISDRFVSLRARQFTRWARASTRSRPQLRSHLVSSDVGVLGL